MEDDYEMKRLGITPVVFLFKNIMHTCESSNFEELMHLSATLPPKIECELWGPLVQIVRREEGQWLDTIEMMPRIPVVGECIMNRDGAFKVGLVLLYAAPTAFPGLTPEISALVTVERVDLQVGLAELVAQHSLCPTNITKN